ncbi:1-aminocyclopropane-1-carboxylate deaminase/D-cysteine desulfhydrase [Aequorivita echinoideorum]|uniref:Pyridoxal-phosphate dependent enzyme n=1 Tax=Aequorivita echinoideorum TaxID=1549647 RepID=A0ABS5S530_9FLAO|nr:pyridoxal-phosphate dependent enzyme [Aequorivita echinoideorum]MBT0607514.1 pyridoxal-phosphate dependent enzyme [Aequorivita echinoideorum]
MFFDTKNVLTASINLKDFGVGNYNLSLRREDLIHPLVSGNKFRKLKYNFEEAIQKKSEAILTFGGAYSNHIAAVAAAGKQCNLKTIGIIRGEELAIKFQQNPTLAFASRCGMHLQFISREQYRLKDQVEFLKNLKKDFGNFYLVPEGGTNQLAVKGCEEIITSEDTQYDYICAPVGTGGTLAGLVRASLPNQKVLGFSALRGNFISSEIEKYTSKTNFEITDSYCFGGYGKIDAVLVRFINEFREKTGIPLDPVYTGKMMFGIIALLKSNYFSENSRILAIHTGGLQGISGMNEKLKNKNLPLIQ